MASSPEPDFGSSEDEFQVDQRKDSKEQVKNEGSGAASGADDASKLFSDEEEEDQVTAKKPSIPADEDDDEDKRKGKEMEDLFGSDYDSEEEEFKASGIKESPVRDEDRMMNDFEESGERDGHLNEFWMPKTPRASKSTSFLISKMPNIIRLVPHAYTKESIMEEMRNPTDETLYRNYVRWRYARDHEGRVRMDPETKLPIRESNSRLVQWEDGTLTLFVGKEALNMSKQKIGNSFLFATESASDRAQVNDDDEDRKGHETVLECQGRILEKFTIRPMTTQSKSHRSLTMSMRAKHNKAVQRVKQYISELDGSIEQEQRMKIKDDQLRLQNRKKARQHYEDDQHRASRMDASFLEEGYEYDDEENVAAIKEQFGGRASSSKKAANSSALRRQRRAHAAASYESGGFDEYRRRSQHAKEKEASDSEQENQLDQDDEDDLDEEEEVMYRTKKRRTVDDEDSE